MMGRQLMVVEDDPAIREMVTTALRQRGWDVRCYPDGAQALAALREHEGAPDAVLLDLLLPEVNGAAFLHLFDAEETPTVAMTAGLPTAGDRAELERLGVHELLRKPFDLDELDQAVARAMARTGSHTEHASTS